MCDVFSTPAVVVWNWKYDLPLPATIFVNMLVISSSHRRTDPMQSQAPLPLSLGYMFQKVLYCVGS